MRIPFGKPLIGDEEKANVLEVLEGNVLVHGPKATQFENDFAAYTGAKHCLSVSSCTAGMHLIYFALGLGAGDEVIVPAQTHVATAHSVELTGARAVFVDVDPIDGTIDPELVEASITERTKAIAVVHYLGVMADMARLKVIADKHNLFLLEDCALAHGGTMNGVHAGLHGDAGVFSFYPVKHMTTGEGGTIILKDDVLLEKLRLAKAFGVDRTHNQRSTPGLYDSLCLGFNYRMSEIHAAIGIAQLAKLDQFLAIRQRNFLMLQNGIKDMPKLTVVPQVYDQQTTSTYYCMGVLLDNAIVESRTEIINALNEAGVGTSIYYPNPVPRLTYYREKYGYEPSMYPNAAMFSDNSIALPVGPHISEEEVDYMIQTINKIVGEY